MAVAFLVLALSACRLLAPNFFAPLFPGVIAVFGLAFFCLAFLASKRLEKGGAGRFWARVSVGAFFLFVASAVRLAGFLLTLAMPFPSIVDGVFFLGQIALVSAVFSGLDAAGSAKLSKAGLGVLVFAGAYVFLLLWFSLLSPLVGWPLPVFEKVFRAALPMASFTLLFSAGFALLKTGSSREPGIRRVLFFFSTGACALSLASLLSIYESLFLLRVGAVGDVLFLAGYGLVVVSALSGSVLSAAPQARRRRAKKKR